jgi:carbamoyl-phosphate synthase large subunit
VSKSQKILILGSGGLRIGQAGEFDYSGSQAIKALKQEGKQVVLVNPNIATVQTDPGLADTVYLQPLTLATVTKIIAKERPSGILLGFGGQTALNLGLELAEKGVLKKYGVEVLGTPVRTIKITEDRELFKQELEKIDVKTPKSFAVTTVEAALEAAEKIKYPVMMRSGFSLGGLGSGRVANAHELRQAASEALHNAPQILIEEYLLGWKEIEYEIVRDRADNCITVCNMENFDPMGIHTGESIVVAPSQTLSNQEYHMLREVAIRVARAVGIVGECNIQYALNPANGDYRVIEMNARLSRSSALASKATGYPLAFVAAKLSLGKLLPELKNSVTKKTSAFFEPALDYLVVKIPRWDLTKFKTAARRIGTQMKSVGEVMAIGRSFPEALQKAVRMLGSGATSLSDYPFPITDRLDEIEHATDRRLFAIYQELLRGTSVEKIHTLSNIDRWFLNHLKTVADLENKLKKNTRLPLHEAKQLGFSDKTLARLLKSTEEKIRQKRIIAGVVPSIKQIDTLAGEFAAETNYLYATYHGSSSDVERSNRKPVVVLGSGPYCIGSSVEFDWCAVNTARSLRKSGEASIIINSNPETVSTDYDESDRLYFEELTLERVRDIVDFENPRGVVVSVGGQIANNLARPLSHAGVKLLGTNADSIDAAENRERFGKLLEKLNIDQPTWTEVTSEAQAAEFAQRVGYPVLVRPSYVLSGTAMRVVYNKEELKQTLEAAGAISREFPVVLSQFILGAKELEIDGVAQNGNLIIEAISEHIENAGVHSGDATVVLPPQRLYLESVRRAKDIAKKIARALKISGPFNIQFLAINNELKVIECNLRASRSFPFVSKVTGHNFIAIAASVLLGNTVPKQTFNTLDLPYVGVKTPQFSYQRISGADPVAGVEMASTGEVATLGDNLMEAFFTSWLATEQAVEGKKVLLSLGAESKERILPLALELDHQGFELYATEGTHDFLAKHGIATTFVYKAGDGQEPSVLTVVGNKEVGLVVNIPSGTGQDTRTDGYAIRRVAVNHRVPILTNVRTAELFLQCLLSLDINKLTPKSHAEFLQTKSIHS